MYICLMFIYLYLYIYIYIYTCEHNKKAASQGKTPDYFRVKIYC